MGSIYGPPPTGQPISAPAPVVVYPPVPVEPTPSPVAPVGQLPTGYQSQKQQDAVESYLQAGYHILSNPTNDGSVWVQKPQQHSSMFLNLILTVFTFGLWIPFWLLQSVANSGATRKVDADGETEVSTSLIVSLVVIGVAVIAGILYGIGSVLWTYVPWLAVGLGIALVFLLLMVLGALWLGNSDNEDRDANILLTLFAIAGAAVITWLAWLIAPVLGIVIGVVLTILGLLLILGTRSEEKDKDDKNKEPSGTDHGR